VKGRSEQLAGGVKMVVNGGILGHPVLIAFELELTEVVLGTIIIHPLLFRLRMEEIQCTSADLKDAVGLVRRK
jgi:hypothetical protein